MAQTNNFFSSFKSGWMRFARVAGNVQARILLTIFFVLILPFALCMQLGQRKKKIPSWDSARKFPNSIQEAQETF
jgi:hypothetical protein